MTGKGLVRIAELNGKELTLFYDFVGFGFVEFENPKVRI
jgi:hypothetical protein